MYIVSLKSIWCGLTNRAKHQPQSKVSLRDLQKSSSSSVAHASSSVPASAPPTSAVQSGLPDGLLISNLSVAAADPCDSISLADVHLPLESIKPSKADKRCHLDIFLLSRTN